jgi:anti-sigma regulatory factor (Ser/Thr protein kinase)
MTGDACHREPPGPPSPGGEQRGAGLSAEERPVLDQTFDGDSLYVLRAAVAAHGARAGLAEDRVGDLILAVHELAANAVRHGAGHGRLRIWITGGELHCEVTDDGPPPTDAAAVNDSVQWNIEPGHGLWVVRQVADRTSLYGGPSGSVVAVSFTLGPPASAGRISSRSRNP